MKRAVPTAEPVRSLARAEDDRLLRLRRVAWILDRSIPIGGGRRIGLDPLLGLFPGFGDAAGAVMSTYIVYEAARIGTPWRVIARMVVNIIIEGVVGAIPLLGDIFDAVWQANIRNLRLVEAAYRPERRERAPRRLFIGALILAVALVALILVLAGAILHALWTYFNGLR